MLDIYSNFDVITELENDIFTVSFLHKRTYEVIFSYEFTVYRNFDKKGLIEDAIDIYKRQIIKFGRNRK